MSSEVCSAVLVGATLGAALAQQNSDVKKPAAAPLGSPAATTSIDGKQLPAPDPKFGGVIKDWLDDLGGLCRPEGGVEDLGDVRRRDW